MEGAAKGDHARAAGVAARDLDGVFHCLGAGGEKGRFGRACDGCACVDALGKRHHAFIGNDLISGVGEAVELGADGGQHGGVAVAGVEHRDAGGKVGEGAAFHVPQGGVLGAVGVEVTHHAHATGGGGLAALVDLLVGLAHGRAREKVEQDLHYSVEWF